MVLFRFDNGSRFCRTVWRSVLQNNWHLSWAKAAQARRGAEDCNQYGEVAAVVARLLKRRPRDEARWIVAYIAELPELLVRRKT
jgi:hypothetical protein